LGELKVSFFIAIIIEGLAIINEITPGIEDPTPYVCEQWPWLMVDGERPDRILKSLSRESNNGGSGGNGAQQLQRRSTPNTSHCSSSLSSGYCSSIANIHANTSSGAHP